MTLALCYEKQNKNMKIISRIHGYDLYNEKFKSGRQQFKEYIDKYENKLMFACEYGKRYCLDYFVDTENKFNKYYLSKIKVEDKFKKTIKKSNKFIVVSCSNIISLKRINLIIDGLSLISDKENQLDIFWRWC